MFRIVSALSIVLVAADPAFAADYGHIHLTATDATAAANWYAKHFGGTPTGFGGDTSEGVKIDRAMFGSIGVIFFQKKAGFEGSVGSALDHIGFSMPDIAGKLKELVDDGAKSLGKVINFGGMDLAFVEDPWGTKIEIIDGPDTRVLHHLHLHSADAKGTLDWYEAAFGGERKKFKGALAAIKYNDIWLIVQGSRKELAPTKGRAMDHLGWNFPDLDAAAKDLEAKGVKFTLEPRPYKTVNIAFIDGPDGVRIELVQP
jgi:catechol 2,3-dioxygenase-like lactoylglutathione lyase family enzyme